MNETMDGHFCKGWVVRARTAKEAAREGWHLRHPIPEGLDPSEVIQPDARELLPGGSNETAGA